ncbi:MAG TPA: helix-turn-helix domain-containing protein, partial [Ramlibacter sp.]|nr:helix-turn-helix domain-containing protein [Ramlibacter sp.]
RGPLKISPAGVELLCSYAWQGNVRELENVLEMAAIVCEGETLDPEHLAYRMKGVAQRAAPAVAAPSAVQAPVQAATVAAPAPAESASVVPIRDAEIDLIRTALREYDCNITLVSRQLQISRSTIYRRMKEHGITKSVRLG